MPNSDLVVLVGIAGGVPIAFVLLRRRGIRGRELFGATWLAFFGLTLLLMMTTHSFEVIYNTIRGGRAVDGSIWQYNFRVYSLLLLAAVLLVQGIRCLRVALRLDNQAEGGRSAATRAALIVFAVAAPLIPIHTFFGVLLTVLSVLTLGALAVAGSRTV